MYQSIRFFLTHALVLAFFLAGCNMPLTRLATPTSLPEAPAIPTAEQPSPVPSPTITTAPTETDEPKPIHIDFPGSPIGAIFQTVHDQVDKNTAPQKQAFGGDDYRTGKYERPFDTEMNYLPMTDIVSVQLNREDPLWIYVLFEVNQPIKEDPAANTHFMVELDTDLDNRGNYLVATGIPQSTDWSTTSVQVLSNPDNNVGGLTVVITDGSPYEGRGYYQEIFNDGSGSDPDLAWSRLSKVNPNVAQIAFKNSLTGGEKGKFIWLPWTDSGMLDWSLFEHNDHIAFTAAGYPLKDDPQNYPLKKLWGIDNTCREPSGFTPNGTMPGLCVTFSPDSPEEPAEPHVPSFCRRPCISHPGCCD
jgi:hypothetical protein